MITSRALFSQQAWKLDKGNYFGFPPPQYLSLNAAGVNISDHSIKTIKLKSVGDNFRLMHHGEISLPDDVVSSGEVKNVDTLKKTLEKLRDKMDLNFVRVSIPEEKGYIFTMKVPATSEEESLVDLIGFKLAEHVPISPTEAVFDYDLLDSKDNSQWVSVSVLPQKIVNLYLEIFRAAKLSPVSFEIEAGTIYRAVVPTHECCQTHVIVDIGKSRTGIFITRSGGVVYTSTLSFGGDDLVGSIEKASGMTTEESERYKRTYGILKRNNKYYESILNEVSVLQDEILRRVEYWRNHAKELGGKPGIDSLILTGGNATTPGLTGYLSRTLGIHTERANVWTNVCDFEKHIPPIDYNHSFGYASAIGLALGSFAYG